ncbi:hypothetical protein Pogu_0807 [Pyrobaculum oguniense TE7]|uniref:Uncharacterized protein n=1 Tax=Pyrobaculum oguniense (strain DSM 13380 / JCM 10595 / TE7) TaxID=698757 RepID=H6Q8A0_PYROT|nr:hypothetical protein Pogu_0807 [Pyrobaculum oguniense TE7]
MACVDGLEAGNVIRKCGDAGVLFLVSVFTDA